MLFPKKAETDRGKWAENAHLIHLLFHRHLSVVNLSKHAALKPASFSEVCTPGESAVEDEPMSVAIGKLITANHTVLTPNNLILL